MSKFKKKYIVAKALELAKQEWLVGENPKRNDSVTDGCSKLADASPLTTQRGWLQTADRSGPWTTKRGQTTVLTELPLIRIQTME